MPVSNKVQEIPERANFLRLAIGILVFGSVWGLVEATLGGFLHLVHYQYAGAITGGIAMSIMAAFVVMYRRPRLAFWIAAIAAMFKPLSALIYAQPVSSPFVYNPASAILLEGLAFTLVVSLLYKGLESSIRTRIAAGVSAGYLSIILYAIVASAAGMGNWASWGLADRARSVLENGTGMAIAGTLLLLLGYLVSVRLRPRFWQLGNARPRLFYASTIAIAAFCWIGAALAFASGL
jgi:hypothetical protein